MTALDSDSALPNDEADQQAYDDYVESVLAGEGTTPDAFLAAHPEASRDLREALDAVWQAAGSLNDPIPRSQASRASEPDDSVPQDAGTSVPTPPADAPEVPFERLGEYRLLRPLDSGGMGAVYLAEQEELGRLVALKLLRPELQGSATLAARFEREAQIVAKLQHPHIVTLFGVGHDQGVRFLAMEYVEGQGLDDIIALAAEEQRQLPIETCLRWAVQVAGALQAAHEAGVVHRDVKPSNIRIRPSGDVVLLDFGIAAEEGASGLTRTGRALGTTGYAAPEQLRGDRETRADARTDVHALGVVLYEMLTGSNPFGGGADAQVTQRVLRDVPKPAGQVRAAISRDLETVLQKALEKEPSRRYASAAEFAADLTAVLAVRPVAARRPSLVRLLWAWRRRRPAAAAVLVVLLFVVFGGAIVAAVGSEWKRHSDARAALTEGRNAVASYQDLAASALEAESTLARLDALTEAAHMTPAQDREHAQAERTVRESRREREALFHETLQHLARAETLDPNIEGPDDVRAALYLERWREARAAKDGAAAAALRHLVLKYAPDGDPAAEVAGVGQVIVACSAAGATARLYPYASVAELVPGGEPRTVPVPIVDATLMPGAWAFRLLSDHGSLEAEDLVVEVNGVAPDEHNWRELGQSLRAGASARVIGRTVRGEVKIQPGARVRITTQPLEWTTDGEVIGLSAPVDVPQGAYVVLVRAPGREPQRVFGGVSGGAQFSHVVELLPAATTPSGFVHVIPAYQPRELAFWMRETEITAIEYLTFLNDPETRAAIDANAAGAANGASQVLIRVPRSPLNARSGGHWPRDEDGRFRLSATTHPNAPVIGVSYHDAEAYCAWWTRRAQQRGEPWRAALPTMAQWTMAASGSKADDFVFGNRFRPKWMNSCFSRSRASIEPVVSYPRDESVAAVFDLSGSVFEWLDDWWDDEQRLRRLGGGSWTRATKDSFKIWGGEGCAPDFAGNETGFRIVLTAVRDK